MYIIESNYSYQGNLIRKSRKHHFTDQVNASKLHVEEVTSAIMPAAPLLACVICSIC